MIEVAQSRSEAQHRADRIRALREDLAALETGGILTLSPDQRSSFDAWCARTLETLAASFDVDTSASQKRVSWGMRIASTLGGFALCAAAVLFFTRYWGLIETPVQIALVIAAPLAALAATEFAARRERTLYYAGLLALVALACFILNLTVVGMVFNITSTENALFAWGLFALLLAYRYGLRLMLAAGLVLLLSWGAAFFTARLGYHWFDCGDRPEPFAALGLLAFAVPFVVAHRRLAGFPSIYRLIGLLAFFIPILGLSEWGARSYLPFGHHTVELTYEFIGLLAASGAIWLGIRKQWDGAVNTAAAFFVIFLYCRLYHWWWDAVPKYVFFALIGAIAIGLVAAFKRVRAHLQQGASA